MFKRKCATCEGVGKIYEGGDEEYCNKCGGSGLVSGLFGPRDCPQCNGTGAGTYNPRKKIRCPTCSGKGWIWASGEPDELDEVY